jgi:hypothetical protein
MLNLIFKQILTRVHISLADYFSQILTIGFEHRCIALLQLHMSALVEIQAAAWGLGVCMCARTHV